MLLQKKKVLSCSVCFFNKFRELLNTRSQRFKDKNKQCVPSGDTVERNMTVAINKSLLNYFLNS